MQQATLRPAHLRLRSGRRAIRRVRVLEVISASAPRYSGELGVVSAGSPWPSDTGGRPVRFLRLLRYQPGRASLRNEGGSRGHVTSGAPDLRIGRAGVVSWAAPDVCKALRMRKSGGPGPHRCRDGRPQPVLRQAKQRRAARRSALAQRRPRSGQQAPVPPDSTTGAIVSARDASLSLQPKRAAHGLHAARLLRSRRGCDLRTGRGRSA